MGSVWPNVPVPDLERLANGVLYDVNRMELQILGLSLCWLRLGEESQHPQNVTLQFLLVGRPARPMRILNECWQREEGWVQQDLAFRVARLPPAFDTGRDSSTQMEVLSWCSHSVAATGRLSA